MLLYKNMTTFITRHKAAFFLFCLGQVVSILSVLVIFNVVTSPQKEEARYLLDIRTFEVTLSDPASLADQMKRLQAEKGDALRGAYAVLDADGIETHALLEGQRDGDRAIVSGRYFTREETRAGEKKLVADRISFQERYDREPAVGERVPIGGQDYEVIGVSISSYHEIPFASLSQEQYPAVESVCVVLEQPPGRSERQDFGAYLSELFPGAGITAPQQRNLDMAGRELAQAVSAVGIGLLAVVNVSFFYAYLLRQRREACAIRAICGCSVRREVAVGLLESVLYASALFALCSLLFHFGIAQLAFFRQFYPNGLDLADYLLLYGLYLAVVLAVFGVRLFRYARRTPQELLREGSV